MFWSKLCKSNWNCALNLAFSVFISPIVWNMCENLPHESVYFKELHNEQECYWPTICRAGAAVVSTITSIFTRSTKVPFILSHAHHAHVLLFFPYTVLSQSVLLGLRFIHNSVSSLPPTLSSDWNLCLALRLLLMFSIYLARPGTYFKQIIILFLYIYKINHLYYSVILD